MGSRNFVFPVFVLHVMRLLILSWSIMYPKLSNCLQLFYAILAVCAAKADVFFYSMRILESCLTTFTVTFPGDVTVCDSDTFRNQCHFSILRSINDPLSNECHNECHNESRQDTSSVTMFALFMSRYVTEACTFCHNEHLRRPKRRSPADMFVRGHSAFLHWQGLIRKGEHRSSNRIQETDSRKASRVCSSIKSGACSGKKRRDEKDKEDGGRAESELKSDSYNDVQGDLSSFLQIPGFWKDLAGYMQDKQWLVAVGISRGASRNFRLQTENSIAREGRWSNMARRPDMTRHLRTFTAFYVRNQKRDDTALDQVT
jgi:hypothetical protein